MSAQFDVTGARAWLNAVPGELGDIYEGRWHSFSQHTKPTLTLYGAYDTGKSSLLRRLIIDSGGHVPEWLTISARHETFEVNEVEIAGCVVRDTPGFVPGASDVRADSNTELAAEAVSLTDVGVVVLTPQLATAEYPVLQQLVRSGWSPRSLWFVISRFDEAGIDPESDLEGYRELAQRKSEELRSALDLNQSFRVHAVCQDFAQMAGSERNPDKQFWDESRSWDGMQELELAIAELSHSEWAPLRNEAGQRFWRQAADSTLRQLKNEFVKYDSRLEVCGEGLALRDSWLSQLEDLQLAAEAELRGRVSEITSEAVYDSAAARLIGDNLKATLDSWYRDQERKIDKLLQTVLATTSTERARSSWQQVQDFVKSVRAQQSKASQRKPNEQLVTPTVEKVANAVLTAFVDYQRLGSLKTAPTAATGAARDTFNKSAAAAVVVGVVEIVGLAEKLYNQQATADEEAHEKERERIRIESELKRVGQQAASVALEALEPLIDEARASINAVTADEVDLLAGLQRTVEELHGHIEAGNQLLANAKVTLGY